MLHVEKEKKLLSAQPGDGRGKADDREEKGGDNPKGAELMGRGYLLVGGASHNLRREA